MNIICVGNGYGNIDIQWLCEERGINILGFFEVKHADRNYFGYREVNLLSADEALYLNYDFLLLCSPFCEKREYYEQLGFKRILSLVSDLEECKRIFGYPKYLVNKRYGITQNKLQTDYEKYAINGKWVDRSGEEAQVSQFQAITDNLYQAYKRAKEQQKREESLYSQEVSWNQYLKATRPEFWDCIGREDTEKLNELLAGFMRNNLSTGILGGAEEFGNFCSRPIISEINNFKQLFHKWKLSIHGLCEAGIADLEIPSIGEPYGLNIDGHLIMGNAFLNHYRSLRIRKLLEEKNGRAVVAELGGGFGCFAYFLEKLSDNITYIDFDLPENLIVESYFLKRCFPDKRILLFDERIQQIDEKLLSSYDIILMPHFMLKKLKDETVDVFVNTISLSEMSFSYIEEYIKQIHRVAKGYFYHENMVEQNYLFENFPALIFPVFEKFSQIYSSPSRWHWFGSTPGEPMYFEYLYKKR